MTVVVFSENYLERINIVRSLRHEGAIVFAAEDILNVLMIIRQYSPDMVVIDYHLRKTGLFEIYETMIREVDIMQVFFIVISNIPITVDEREKMDLLHMPVCFRMSVSGKKLIEVYNSRN